MGVLAFRTSTRCTPGKHDDEVQFCAFNILAEGDDDVRKLPLSMRKADLERLLARRPDGLFRDECDMGLEGLALPGRQVEALDQGEEPDTPSDEPQLK